MHDEHFVFFFYFYISTLDGAGGVRKDGDAEEKKKEK